MTASETPAVPSPAVHANCVIVGTLGILVRGRAGRGKTSLADALMEAAGKKGNYARLVADDYVHLSETGGLLLAKPPEAIRGKMEVRGFGVVNLPEEPVACVNLLVSLHPLEAMDRLPETSINLADLNGVEVPEIICPEDNLILSLRLVRWALRMLFPDSPDYI